MQMTRRTNCKKIGNAGNSKQMTRRTNCKKIATRKTHEVSKTGASEGAHTCRWLRVLPVVVQLVALPPALPVLVQLVVLPLVLPMVPLPALISRYSEPSRDAGWLPLGSR